MVFLKLGVTNGSSAQSEQILCNEGTFDAVCPVAQSTRPGTLDSIGDSGRNLLLRCLLSRNDALEDAALVEVLGQQHRCSLAARRVVVHHVRPLGELKEAVGLLLGHAGLADGIDRVLDAAGDGNALVGDALALRRHGLGLGLRRNDGLRLGSVGVVGRALEVVLRGDDVVHRLLNLLRQLDARNEGGHQHVAVVEHLGGNNLIDGVGDGVLLGEDLVERARRNLRAQRVGQVVLHLPHGILQRVEAAVDAGIRALLNVAVVNVILNRDVQLNSHVVRGLGVKRHVLVLGHEAHVVRDVNEGKLHVEAGAGEPVKLAQALDDGNVLLAHNVAR